MTAVNLILSETQELLRQQGFDTLINKGSQLVIKRGGQTLRVMARKDPTGYYLEAEGDESSWLLYEPWSGEEVVAWLRGLTLGYQPVLH